MASPPASPQERQAAPASPSPVAEAAEVLAETLVVPAEGPTLETGAEEGPSSSQTDRPKENELKNKKPGATGKASAKAKAKAKAASKAKAQAKQKAKLKAAFARGLDSQGAEADVPNEDDPAQDAAPKAPRRRKTSKGKDDSAEVGRPEQNAATDDQKNSAGQTKSRGKGKGKTGKGKGKNGKGPKPQEEKGKHNKKADEEDAEEEQTASAQGANTQQTEKTRAKENKGKGKRKADKEDAAEEQPPAPKKTLKQKAADLATWAESETAEVPAKRDAVKARFLKARRTSGALPQQLLELLDNGTRAEKTDLVNRLVKRDSAGHLHLDLQDSAISERLTKYEETKGTNLQTGVTESVAAQRVGGQASAHIPRTSVR